MKITSVRLGRISVPLRTPFKTALRSVSSVEDVIVEIHTDCGAVGYGEAPPTGAITGDTTGAIIGAIQDHIAKTIIGRDVDELEPLLQSVQKCIVGNSSAKAAVDMALWDLYGQLYNIPVYKLLGGGRKQIVTDITISVNDPDTMVSDSLKAVARGYDCLKMKVGVNPELDVARLSAVRNAVGKDIVIRIDANQAWNAKQAVRILDQMQEKGLDIEFVEQPVPAADLEGMQYVTRHASVPVLADESVFSPADALRIMQTGAADFVNIKLMKCGGITNALRIAAGLGFIRPVSCCGAALLPLLQALPSPEEESWYRQVVAFARVQAARYPYFLVPPLPPGEEMTATELQVLRLMCADKSNAEIGRILDIKLPTVKTHVSHILTKLNVSRRSEAKTAARRLWLVE